MTLALLTLSLWVPGEAALAKGCVKGALAGGVIGHYAGHHGVIGAIAGCLYGRHQAGARRYGDAQRSHGRGWL